MSADPGRVSRFWQELKRRRVVKVIAMYAATAYIILEASDIILPRLGLPDWTVTFLLVLIIVGFPITVILSWIFDVTPQGVRKTESLDEIANNEAAAYTSPETAQGNTPGAIPEPVASAARTKRIFSPSNIIIALLLVVVCILLYPKIFKPDQLKDLRDEEGMISLAVLPFDNLTGDSSLYFWQNGISEYLINRLGNSEELAVSSSQVVSDVLEGTRQVNAASLSPDIARKTALKIDASTYITGNFIGKGNDACIMLNLVNTESGEMIWTTSMDGDLEGNYREVLGRLADTVRNYMEISVLEKQAGSDLSNAYPNSAEAYKHYIDGLNSIMDEQYSNAIESLKEAYGIDTTFTFAAFYLAYAYNFGGYFNEDMLHWIRRAWELKNNLPPVYRPWLEEWYASFITEDYDELERYAEMMDKAALHSRLLLFDLATTYDQFLDNHVKSIQTFQKIESLNELWEDDWRYDNYYSQYSINLLYEEQTEEALRIIEKGLVINPDNEDLFINMGAAHIIAEDSAALNRSIERYWSWVEGRGLEEAAGEYGIGLMYTLARDSLDALPHFRKSYEMDPELYMSLSNLIQCQLRSNIDAEECLRLAQSGYEQFPDVVDFPIEIGVSLAILGRTEEALSILRIADEEYYRGQVTVHNFIREIERSLALQNQ